VIRHTLRLRLAVSYGGVFLVSGVILLGIVFALFNGRSTRATAPAPDQPAAGGASPACR
jgi:hypothetical protein